MAKKDGEVVERKDVAKCVENVVGKVENVWDTKLTEYIIKVIPVKKFLVRLQITDQEVNRLLPPEKRKKVHTYSPGAVSYCFKKEILIPDEYITRVINLPKSMRLDPYDSEIGKLKAKKQYSKWKKPILESVATEEISHLIFRQEREETGKKEYTDFATNCSMGALNWISMHNEILAHYVGKKILTLSEHIPIVLRDRLMDIWSNAQRRESYSAIQALNQHYSISKLASFDAIAIPPGMEGTTPQPIAFLMFDEHPTYKRRFEKIKDIWQKNILP